MGMEFLLSVTALLAAARRAGWTMGQLQVALELSRARYLSADELRDKTGMSFEGARKACFRLREMEVAGCQWDGRGCSVYFLTEGGVALVADFLPVGLPEVAKDEVKGVKGDVEGEGEVLL